MADAPPSTPVARGQGNRLYRLEVSRYEQVASMLLALLVFFGAVVTIMVVVWLTGKIFASHAAVPFTMEEIGSDEDPMGPGDDIEPPPPQETDLEEEEIDEIIEAVEDVVATRSAMLERRVSGTGTGRGGGGTGTGRKGKPRRWEVSFAKGLTLEEYAKQLEFFGIELGVMMPNNRVEYAYNLTRSRPSRRSGTIEEENARKRFYLTWRHGELQEADRQLLARAGIQAGRRIILKFLTPETERKLYDLEKTYANGREVRRTLFSVVPDGEGYQFQVVRQWER
ncbi:MAG: hypothetical protein JW809_17635 [Pirellulales bacterium]|nr:hypothetical protein [Pirellulales bacterium]